MTERNGALEITQDQGKLESSIWSYEKKMNDKGITRKDTRPRIRFYHCKNQSNKNLKISKPRHPHILTFNLRTQTRNTGVASIDVVDGSIDRHYGIAQYVSLCQYLRPRRTSDTLGENYGACNSFYLLSQCIAMVLLTNRQTDRQTDRQIDRPTRRKKICVIVCP